MTTTSSMQTTTVLAFPQRAIHNRRIWRQDELQTLVALYAAHAAHGDVESWDVGATEVGDPQFYLMGPAPDHDCLLSVSRIGRTYVLEDRFGVVLAEGAHLGPVIETATRSLSRRYKTFVVRVLLALCAFRLMIEQKIEPFLAESTENFARFAPQMAALV
jgi:hypothetical protein